MGFIEDVLIDGLGVRHLVVGDDFRFGCDRAGDFSLLREVGEQRGFTVENTRTVTVHGERVSSTRIRGVLSENRINDAEDLLGHPYRLRGRIVMAGSWGGRLARPRRTFCYLICRR